MRRTLEDSRNETAYGCNSRIVQAFAAFSLARGVNFSHMLVLSPTKMNLIAAWPRRTFSGMTWKLLYLLWKKQLRIQRTLNE